MNDDTSLTNELLRSNMSLRADLSGQAVRIIALERENAELLASLAALAQTISPPRPSCHPKDEAGFYTPTHPV